MLRNIEIPKGREEILAKNPDGNSHKNVDRFFLWKRPLTSKITKILL